jgi:ABC-type phosphate transport system substrate-binding protein
MQNASIIKLGVGGAIALALSLGVISPASADVQPQSTDAVAVGSDTVQYVADFVADGSPTGLNGFNTTNARRIFSFDATGDASGRAAYQNGTATALPASVVLRAGQKPVTRPNGSGAGISALLTDNTHQIDFVRSSRLPKASEQSTANGLFGGIHVYKIATDGLQVAVNASAPATQDWNGPAGLSAAELVNIYNGTYKRWSDITAVNPGFVSPAPNDAIVPILPQVGSGTRNDFLADLKIANGGVDVPLTSTVRTSEEHDPTAISAMANGTMTFADSTTAPYTKKDALAPFSTGRDKLIDTSYFGLTPAANTVYLLNGAAPDGAAATSYNLARTLYLLARQTDVTSTTPFLAGGSLNLVNALFGTATSQFGKVQSSSLFTAAGVTRSWADLNFASAG